MVCTDHTTANCKLQELLLSCPFVDCNFSFSTSLQDSDDEANDDSDTLEKPAMKKEFSHRSPSPPAEDSEPEMTEEEKEFQLVCSLNNLSIVISYAFRVCNTHELFSPFWTMFLDDHHKNSSDGDPVGSH